MKDQTLIKDYIKTFDEIYGQIRQSEEYQRERVSVIDRKIRQVLMPFIPKINSSLKVIFDARIGKAILESVRQVQIAFKSVKTHEKFIVWKSKLQYLRTLSISLKNKSLVSKKNYNEVNVAIKSIQNNCEYKLQEQYNLLYDSSDREQFRSDFFDSMKIQITDISNDEQVSVAYKNFFTFALGKFNKKLMAKLEYLVRKFQDLEQMLGIGLIRQMEDFLQNDIGKDDEEIFINHQLRKLATEECLDSNIQHKQKIQEYYEFLKGILNKFSGMKVFSQQHKIKFYLAKFGSNVSGFASKSTDMDLTVLTDCYIEQKGLLRVLYKFIEAQFRQKFEDYGKNIYKLQFVESARIPVIKLHFLKTKQAEFHFDIIVNNILGVINSKFLAVYGSISWIRDLGILIKTWGKNKGLISEWKFSSYSLNLLLINFLLQTRRINLIMDARSRQNSAPHFTYKRLIKNQPESFKVYYQFKSNPEDVTNLKRVNYYQILSEFFDYYKKNGEHWKLPESQRIITVDGSKKKIYDQDYIFTMKDPFDETHNPGRVRIAQKNNIMQTFSNASQAMQQKNWQTVKNLFESKIIC